MGEDSFLDGYWEERISGPEPYWEDDLYQFNLAEADDYRDEGSDWE